MTKIVTEDQRALKERKRNEFEFGLLPNNKKIGQYRSIDYAHKKYGMNSLAGLGYVDLIFTGSFVNSLFVMSKNKGFIFDTNQEEKQGNLIARYSEDIMGLNQDWFVERQKTIHKTELVNKISAILNKK